MEIILVLFFIFLFIEAVNQGNRVTVSDFFLLIVCVSTVVCYCPVTIQSSKVYPRGSKFIDDRGV